MLVSFSGLETQALRSPVPRDASINQSINQSRVVSLLIGFMGTCVRDSSLHVFTIMQLWVLIPPFGWTLTLWITLGLENPVVAGDL